jgi:hypothetical protein
MIWMDVHVSVQLTWSIANFEACRSGSSQIEPVHFVLGVLKVMDLNFSRDALAMGLPADILTSIIPVAEQCRERLNISGDEIKRARRNIRKAVRGPSTQPTDITLHRSPEARTLFKRAGKRAIEAGEDELSLTHLLEELIAVWPAEAATFVMPPQVTNTPEQDEEWPSYIQDPFNK